MLIVELDHQQTIGQFTRYAVFYSPQRLHSLSAFGLARISPLELTDLDGFLALCPSGDLQALSSLAARCVKDLDVFRIPMSKEERERRIATTKLSRHQRELLNEWGYPFVLDQFRFHITLTRRLTGMERATLVPALETRLEQELRQWRLNCFAWAYRPAMINAFLPTRT